MVDEFVEVPHAYANDEESGVDWYAMSCHKLFGLHSGVLCGRREAVKDTTTVGSGGWDRRGDEDVYQERTEVNCEACAGIWRINVYFSNPALL